MKIGYRKPSLKKSISAKTSGRLKRSIKKATNPTYGKKGMGLIKDPKKSIYNKVYNQTTVSLTGKSSGQAKQSLKKSRSSSYSGMSSFDDILLETDGYQSEYVEKVSAELEKKQKEQASILPGCGMAICLIVFVFSIYSLNFVTLALSYGLMYLCKRKLDKINKK